MVTRFSRLPGGHKLRSAVVLALLAVGITGAWAAKLDKNTCNELSAELASATAAGVKGDMERGPEWAKSNLPPERLASIQRLIDVQEQLQFRCGIRPKGSPAKPDAPGGTDDTPGVKVEAPASKPDAQKLDGKAGSTATPPAREKRLQAAPVAPKSMIVPPAATAKSADAPPAATAATAPPAAPATAKPVVQAPTVAAHLPAAAPSLTKPAALDSPPASALGGPPVTKLAPLVPAAASPPSVNPVATKPAAVAPVIAANPPAAGTPITKLAPLNPAVGNAPGSPPVTKLAPLSPAAAGQAALPPAGIQPPAKPGAPALTRPANPAAQTLGTAAARKKPSRKDSTSAYVAPGDVAPLDLSGQGGLR